MIVKILNNNTKEFDNGLLEYSIQIKALNYLKKNGKIKEDFYEKVKSVINNNYTIEKK